MPDEPHPSRRGILAVGAGASLTAVSQGLPAALGEQPWPSSVPPANADVFLGEFLASGEGATRRTVTAKLRDLASVADYGARADGRAQEFFAFTKAAASLPAGGPLDVTAGIHLVGSQTFGPARGNVHAYDTAVIGDRDIIADGSFSTRHASPWILQEFHPVSGGMGHNAGKPGSIGQSIIIKPYTSYVIEVVVETVKAGGVAFFVGGRPIFTEGDYSILPAGRDRYSFTIFSYDLTGNIFLNIGFDQDWSGSVQKVSLREVEREAPYDFFSIPHDKRDFSNILGIKFGRFLSGNIAIGDRLTSCMMSEKAGWNVAIGPRALSTNTDDFENTAIGAFVLEYNQASRNVAGGYSAFRYNTKGKQNTGWGYKTFGRNSTGSNNTGVGFWSGLYNQLGSDNSYFGARAGYYNCNGSYNSFLGSQAGLQNDGGIANTYVGAISGPYTPGARTFCYSHSTCIGAESKGYGDRTTAIGNQARCGSDPYAGGRAITTTATALGHGAVAVDDGTSAIGGNANAAGMRSTCIGEGSATSGVAGTAIGASARATEVSTAIGVGAGVGVSGKGNLSIGVGANGGDTVRAYHNTIAVGNDAMCSGSNQITLGNENITQIRSATAVITTLSDGRYKENVEYFDIENASRLLLDLKPARWNWKMRDETTRGQGDIGFVAQDLLWAQEKHKAGWLNLVDASDEDRLYAAPGRLIPVLVAALQDALHRIEELEARV